MAGLCPKGSLDNTQTSLCILYGDNKEHHLKVIQGEPEAGSQFKSCIQSVM